MRPERSSDDMRIALGSPNASRRADPERIDLVAERY